MKTHLSLLPNALARRDFLALGGALLLPALAGQGAFAQVQPQPVSGGRLRVQMQLGPLQDPMLATRPQMTNFTRGWLEYLVEYRGDRKFHPRLLSSWTLSEDARHAVLNLRPGVTWSNGEAFTAEHVAFNLRRWCDIRTPGNSMAWRMAALINPITGQIAQDAVEIIDPLTLHLNLRTPDVTLIAGFADYPAAVVHPGFNADDMLTAPVGTGPYFPESYTPGTKASLLRRDGHWWGRGSGAWLERIDYVDTGAAPLRAAEAAKAGLIDVTDESRPELGAALEGDLGWRASVRPSASTIAARFNQRDPLFADIRVREALTLAVDNQTVLEVALGRRGGLGENHHVWPGHPDYAALDLQAPNPARARELLEEAGRLDHEFELISLDDDWQATSADVIAAQCLDAGIRVRRRRLPAEAFWAGWTQHPWSVTEWNMRPLGVQTLALAYRSGSVWNDSGFNDPEFDRLLDLALSLASHAERRPVMAQLQERLQSRFVMIQPFWRDLTCHSAPGVFGVEVHPMLEHHHTEWWRDPPIDPDAPPP